MRQLDSLTHLASEQLAILGFEPLDDLGGHIGGERHGVWDWTWTSRRAEHECYASLYAWPNGRQRYDFEVWAGSGIASHPRVLVRHVVADLEELRLREGEILEALLEAASRAGRLPDIVASTTRVESATESAPYSEIVAAVERLFREQPERELRNGDVLKALVAAGYPTDRAAVNAALSLLARMGRIRRVRHGLYTG